MDLQPKTIFIAVDQGFSIRYLLRTDVFAELKQAGHRLVILSPNHDEEYFVREFADENVFLEPYRVGEYERYFTRSRVQRFLKTLRDYSYDARYKCPMLDHWYEEFRRSYRKAGPARRLYGLAAALGIGALRRSRTLRRALIGLESRMFTPNTHTDLFEKYKPDLLIAPSLGNLSHDRYVMREAKGHGVPVLAVILSWDNPTTKGLQGAVADRVVAWTEVMKDELVRFKDVPEDKIEVGGVAYYDAYFRPDELKDFAWLEKKFGLVPDRKLIFLCLMSPTQYGHNPEMIEILAEAVQEERFSRPAQVLIRPHPIYFRTESGAYVNQEEIAGLFALRDKYEHVHFDFPEILSRGVSYDMPAREMVKLGTILKYSSAVVCFYSSMMIEAALFDVPVINMGLFEKNNIPMHTLETYNHIARILQTNGVRNAYAKDELTSLVNAYFDDPSMDREGRQRIRDREAGPNPGRAGKHIAGIVEEMLARTRPGG